MGAEAMRLLLKRRPIPDGVFAYNDSLAIGVIEAILEAGLHIPEDIASDLLMKTSMTEPSMKISAQLAALQ